MKQFGKDHWSTFAYIENCVVDKDGRIEPSRMRTDGKKYPTRLKNEIAKDHNDWDCVNDLESQGLLLWQGTGTNPTFKLTEKGWVVAGQLRKWKSEGGTFADFTPRI